MKPYCQIIISAVATLVLVGAINCRYTGGDDATEQSSPPDSTRQTSPVHESTGPDGGRQPSASSQPTSPTPAASGAGDANGLGEGTDGQQALMARAKQAFLSNRTGRAEDLFEKLVATKPVSGPQVSAAIALAQIYNETDRPAQAIALYEGLAERVDEVPEVQLVIARAFAKQGQTSRAIQAYDKLLDLQPDYAFALLELGKLYARSGHEDHSKKTLYRYEKKIYSLAKQLEAPATKPAQRLYILDIFSLVSDDRAIEACVKSMGADTAQVREKAAIVLGQVRATEATEVLERAAVEDPNLKVRLAAKDALDDLAKVDAALETNDSTIGPTFVEDKDQLSDP